MLKLIDHDGYVVNDFNQSINIDDNPSGSITSESSKNQFIQNDELQRHSIIYNNQNRGEIANNIGSFDFEAEIKKLLAVQKKYRYIHDKKEQEKTKISQQKGKCKVVDESEDEFQLNHFNPNRYKMLEIQQNESMIDKKDTKYRNDEKKNPLQPILVNPTIDITNNLQINAVIRNDKPAESLCHRLCRFIGFLQQPVQRTNTRIYQDHNTSRQNLNTSRFDATNINDFSQYSHRQIDSSRPLVNHRSSFERLGRQDPDTLVPHKPKKGMFR